MALSEQEKEQYLDVAKQIVESLEQQDDARFERLVDDLTRLRETALFQEVGKLTRELHEALKSFRVDSRLTEIAASDIPDARDRLNYVLTLTDQAAHRTLNAIEASVSLTDDITSRSRHLLEQWQRFRNRELSVDQFRQLSREIEEFLGLVDGNGAELQSNLSDALMAQDYQDLTGQVIRRVITLVQEVESGLVDLMRIAKPKPVEAAETETAADNDKEKEAEESTKGSGPAIPGKDEDVVQGQDEVDDLLSSLGF